MRAIIAAVANKDWDNDASKATRLHVWSVSNYEGTYPTPFPFSGPNKNSKTNLPLKI